MFATIADYAKLGSIFLNVSAPASETLSLFDTANTFNNLPAGGVNHASIVHIIHIIHIMFLGNRVELLLAACRAVSFRALKFCRKSGWITALRPLLEAMYLAAAIMARAGGSRASPVRFPAQTTIYTLISVCYRGYTSSCTHL